MAKKNRLSEIISSIKAEYAEVKVIRPFKELISFGNTKLSIGINGENIAIFNITTATDCASHKLGLCKYRDICYALKAEKRWKQVIPYRNVQTEYWDSHTSNDFVADLLSVIHKEKRTVKALRFNESGDIRDIDDLTKIIMIAEMLPFPVYLYTARKDIFNNYTINGLEYTNLTINGSGFMVHNEFRIVNTDFDLILNEDYKVCNGDCSVCSLCVKKGKKVIQVIKH